jgi:hypothetical protein
MHPSASSRPWPQASAIWRNDARDEETCEAHSEEAASEARKAPARASSSIGHPPRPGGLVQRDPCCRSGMGPGAIGNGAWSSAGPRAGEEPEP